MMKLNPVWTGTYHRSPDGRSSQRRAAQRFGRFAACLLLSSGLVSLVPGQSSPAENGVWEQVVDLPLQPIHMVLMKNGKVLCLDSTTQQPDTLVIDAKLGQAVMLEVPPGTGQQPTPVNYFCGGHAQLADGQILFVGGGGATSHAAHNHAHLFNPDAPLSDPWVPVEDLPNDLPGTGLID